MTEPTTYHNGALQMYPCFADYPCLAVYQLLSYQPALDAVKNHIPVDRPRRYHLWDTYFVIVNEIAERERDTKCTSFKRGHLKQTALV